MDTDTLKQTITAYQGQLEQVEAALLVDQSNSDLLELKENLAEVITLTQESLLSLTKAEALQKLGITGDANADEVDDEYAAFQAALGDDVTASSSTTPQPQSQTDTATDSDSEETILSSNLDDIIGTCVQAPHSHSWGGYQYHNAAIIGLDTNNEKVRIMFIQPTHITMKICPHYLDGRCKYDDDDCRLSHGTLIPIDDLREYEPSTSSTLSVGDVCLAKFEYDALWYKATIVDTHGEEFLEVMFDDYGEATHAVERENVIPLAGSADDSGSSSSSEDEQESGAASNNPARGGDRNGDLQRDQDSDDRPNYLWKPNDDDGFGEWELHTRGVGSKLMAAMGYKPGDGLGKASQGRVQLVPILKLPPGQSLDRIMQLKEKTGNRDMFDVMKKHKHHKLKKMKAGNKKQTRPADLFTYLNKSLAHGNRVDLTSYRKSHKSKAEKPPPSVINKHQLSKKSDKDLNVQVMKTEEEISRVQGEILSIKRRLEVNVTRRDTGGVNHLTGKLTKAEQYLKTLRRSAAELNRHRGQRDSKKKLMVF